MHPGLSWAIVLAVNEPSLEQVEILDELPQCRGHYFESIT